MMKKLYHFTSWHHLHAIGRCGLTVGDVPTDIHRGRAAAGVADLGRHRARAWPPTNINQPR